MEHLVRELFRKEGYVYARSPEEIAREFGIERVARLASNENPFGPSPAALREAGTALETMHRYPGTSVYALIQALKNYHGDYAFVSGVGMDGVIETCIRTLVNPGDRVTISVPTFSFYGLAAAAQGAEITTVPRETDFSVDPYQFIRAAQGSKISFLCSPNNPTGTITPVQDVATIAESIDGLLFLDNAYVEFSGVDYLPLLNRFDNIIIGRTFSKVFGLAGCRVGYAFVPCWFRPYYETAATPFTLATVPAAAATGALSDRDHVDRTIRHVQRWIRRIRDECPMPSAPSGANFVMFDTSPLSGDRAADLFARQGVIVRSCRSFPGLPPHFIRVCVGEDWEMEQFLSAADRVC